jgi:hypothetical protein
MAEEQRNVLYEDMTEEEVALMLTAPEKLWKKTTCSQCWSVVIEHDPHFDKTNARSYWCDKCFPVVMEQINNRKSVSAQPVERARHDQLMAEQQQGVASHSDDCGCGYCKPLGVSRSATFAVAQAALRPEEQPTVTEERPRLTLKVER